MFEPKLKEPVLIYITRIFLLLLPIQALFQLDQRFQRPLKWNFVDSDIFIFPSSSIRVFFVYSWIRILIEIVGIIFATGLGFSLSICDWIAFLVIFGTFGAITRLITLILLWIWVIRLDIFLSDHLDHDSEHLTLSLLLDVFLFDVIDHF